MDFPLLGDGHGEIHASKEVRTDDKDTLKGSEHTLGMEEPASGKKKWSV